MYVCIYIYRYSNPQKYLPYWGCYKHPIPGLTINNME